MTPLYGHTSIETAYNVSDYPYGRLRCKIRYWIEESGKKGFRFCSQTENPKTGRWNKEKKGTYSLFALAMYLDEKGHVTYSELSEWSSGKQALEFVQNFPGAPLERVREFAVKKIAYEKAMIAGLIVWRINGVAQPVKETDIEHAKVELAGWEAALNEMNKV